MWWMDGFHWGWMVFGGVMMLLFWGGLIALAVVIIRAISGSGRSSNGEGHRTALDILKERYAKGELTKNEFESMRTDLGG